MEIFIDTEFTALSRDAQLLSFGAISEDGREFYVELDPIPVSACSEFVRQYVLPLFVGGAANCPRALFAKRLADWLRGFDQPHLIADSDWDAYVLRYALTGTYSRAAGLLDFPGNGDLEAILQLLPKLSPEASDLLNSAMAAHFALDPRQHHALVDARALRQGIDGLRKRRQSIESRR